MAVQMLHAHRQKERSHQSSRGGLLAVGSWALLVLLLPVSGALVAQEEQSADLIEEVIVTGTYIRRQDMFDTTNPVDIMTSSEISEYGTPNLGEVIRQQSFNYGVDTVTNILAPSSDGATGLDSQANIRGLGTGATLTLWDGRRTLNQNLQTAYPQIAVARLETMTDGGAVLYGTDAVAGVLNVIPRRRMEGIEVRASINATDSSGFDDWREGAWSIMGGSSSADGNTHVAAALEFRDRTELRSIERGRFVRAGVSSSGEGMPGTFLVPQRDENGEPLRDEDGAVVRESTADPGCGLHNDLGPGGAARGEDKTQIGNHITGFLAFGTCRREFGDSFNFINPQEVLTAVAFVDHTFGDTFSFEGEMFFSRQDTESRGSASRSGGRVSELPIVPGEHPGNPFRAMTADGQVLFAQPADPDNPEDFQPARDQDGNVVLAENQFASLDEDPDAGGVPFNEDVRISEWRPISKLQQPTRNTRNDPGEFTAQGNSTWVANNYRWVGRLNIAIPNTNWSGWADYTYHKTEVTQRLPAGSLEAIRDGLVGELFVDDRDQYFNPFSTQSFGCVNRVCADEDGNPLPPNQPNTIEVLDRIVFEEKEVTERTLNVVDVVFTGDVVNLPAGPIGAALGGQWRHINEDFDAGPVSNARDDFVRVQALDWQERRTTFAGFAEVDFPLFDTSQVGRVDVNAAVRTERGRDDSDADLDTTDWKAGLRWEVRPFVAMRASAGTAFISPELSDLFSPSSFNRANVSDPLFDRGQSFKARGTGGNPNLQSEEADTYNLGVTFRLLEDDLTIAADWKVFDFTDRISRPIPEDVVRGDFERFQDLFDQGAFDPFVTGTATFEQARRLFIENNPNQAGADPGIPGEDPRILRNLETTVVRAIETPLQNVSSMVWRGADLNIQYRFNSRQIPWVDADFGGFRAQLAATYVDEYSFKESPDERSVEGAGNRNVPTGFVPPIPRWRGTVTFGWSMGRHAVTLLGRYQHHVVDDDTLCELSPFVLTAIKSFVGQVRAGDPSRGCAEKTRSMTEWDLHYRLQLDGLIGDRAAHLEMGAINLFDTLPIPSAALAGFDPFLFDPRGRQLYLRLQTDI